MKSGASISDISATVGTPVLDVLTVILAVLILETFVGIRGLTLRKPR